MKAIRVSRTGGPEVLLLEEVATPDPGPGEVRVRLAFSGVNFVDTYQRSGLYPVPLPFTPGSEGAGEVDAVGPDVAELRAGDRVAYASERGSYAAVAIVPAAKLVPVPAGVSLDTAAAVMLQGMTAHYLAHDTFPLDGGSVALVHAAAGGVGLLLVQMARMLGARVIGTTSTEEKAQLARHAGAEEVVLYTHDNFRDRALAFTGGRGVDVVYDSVGRTTFADSLRSLRPRGLMVSFGQSSGAVPPFDPLLLSRRGSLFLTRPTLANFIADRGDLLRRAGDVMRWIADGKLDVRIDRTLDLAAAPSAHRLLESRATAGTLLLRC
ncbi:MAG: quinone oxidoreductase family protein [Longimicrobiales bacterium]